MKLEIENASSDFSEQHQSSENLSDEQVSELLDQGIQAAENGNRRKARQLFQRVIETDSKNETAWFWLASIGEYPEEVLASLQHVLEINPQNERALELSEIAGSLLAETFIHHGSKALERNRKELAAQCFLQAVSHNPKNENGWLQLSFLADSPEEKTSHLQKVLDLDPDNETALSAMESLKREALDLLMKKANSAAISGERETALQLLEEAAQSSPDLEEVWILRAYLAESFHEKILCYEKTLQLNSENEAAQAGLFSLRALIQRTEEQKPLAEAIEEAFENNNLSDSEDLSNDPSNSENSFSEETDSAQEAAETVETIMFENETSNGFEYSEEVEFAETSASERSETVTFAETDILNLQEPEANFSAIPTTADSDEHLDFELVVESRLQEMPDNSNGDFFESEDSRFVFDNAPKMIPETGVYFESPLNIQMMDSPPVETFFASDDLTVETEEVSETLSGEDVNTENKVTTIMIVDDNPTILKLVSGKLEKSGYNVVPAINGKEALLKISDVTPDLILLDITMPKMDGYQVCKIIRSHEETKNVPVLMISSKDGIFDESRGKMAGSTGFISKPFGPESLMRTVENYLR